jgi:hypothetical protein
MVQPPSIPYEGRPAHHVGLYPTTFPPQFAAGPASPPAGLPGPVVTRTPAARRVRSRKHAIRQVVVVDVAGRLGEVARDLDRAIQLALAEGPRGVVCDLSAVLEGTDPIAVEVLATAGRHVCAWPGIPLAVACPDPRIREALAAHPLGKHLIVTSSLVTAVSAVLATPTLSCEWLQLAPHPTAPRASREFVTRTLLDWRLGRAIPFASLVVGELVASSTVNAGTEVDLSVAWDRGSLRLTVRDHGPALRGQQPSALELRGRGLTVVAGLSRSFGILPAADGGKVVWAVLDAPRPRTSNRPIWSDRSTSTQTSPVFTDGRGTAELPFCAGVGRPSD